MCVKLFIVLCIHKFAFWTVTHTVTVVDLMLASSKLWAILREVVAMEQIVFRISTYLALLEDTQLKKDQFLDKLIS